MPEGEQELRGLSPELQGEIDEAKHTILALTEVATRRHIDEAAVAERALETSIGHAEAEAHLISPEGALRVTYGVTNRLMDTIDMSYYTTMNMLVPDNFYDNLTRRTTETRTVVVAFDDIECTLEAVSYSERVGHVGTGETGESVLVKVRPTGPDRDTRKYAAYRITDDTIRAPRGDYLSGSVTSLRALLDEVAPAIQGIEATGAEDLSRGWHHDAEDEDALTATAHR